MSARAGPELEATFEAVEAGGIPRCPGRGWEEDASANQLELHPRRRGAGHLGDAGVDDVGRARELTWAESRLLPTHPVELIFGDAAQHLGCPVGHRRDDDEVAQALQQVHREPPRVVPRLNHLVDLGKH